MVETKMLQELLEKKQERVEELEYELEKMKKQIKISKMIVISAMVVVIIFVAVMCVIIKTIVAETLEIPISYMYQTFIEIGLVMEFLLFYILYYLIKK